MATSPSDHPQDTAQDCAVSPPNAEIRAWLQVVGSFFLFFNTWGIINSYGVFQTFYEGDFLEGTAPSTISWVGSLQSFLMMFLGVFLCHNFWQVLLAQAFCVGIGGGLIFVPSIAILSTYFTTKLPLAVGIAASGSSIGGVIYPILIRRLLDMIGFGWAIRVAGFVALFGLSTSCLVLKIRTLPANRRKLIDWAAFYEPPYALFNIGLFLCFMGLYTPFYYIQSVAIENHITSETLAFYLVPIMNATSTFGRLAPGYISKWAGSLNILVLCAILSGILVLCIIAIKTQGSLLAICALYGFFSGSLVSLMGPILIMLSPHRGVTGTRMGMCFTLLGMALLIGTPIAGAILDAHGANMVWVYSAVLTLSGGAVLGAARMSLASQKSSVTN
ncbi:major facilitator superfamily domain-containing protein [Aspergillus insuetus]